HRTSRTCAKCSKCPSRRNESRRGTSAVSYLSPQELHAVDGDTVADRLNAHRAIAEIDSSAIERPMFGAAIAVAYRHAAVRADLDRLPLARPVRAPGRAPRPPPR